MAPDGCQLGHQEKVCCLHLVDMEHLLYASIRCPAPPQWLIDRALEKLHDGDQPTQADLLDWNQSFTERQLIRDGEVLQNAFNRSLYLDQESLDWARKNIGPDVIDMRIVITEVGALHKGPHIDVTRKYSGLFLLEPGGRGHLTCFYRSRATGEMTGKPGDHIDDFSQVETVCCVRVPERSWAMINAHVLHGVENIPGGRIALQFSADHIDRLDLADQIIVK